MRRAFLPAALFAAACVGNIGDGDDGLLEPPGAGVAELGMRRLTPREYDQTVLDLIGDASVDSAAVFPSEVPSPFDNDYPSQTPSRVLVEAAETLARDVSARLLADTARRDTVVGCVPAAVQDDACMTTFVRRFGRRALRRPLLDAEVAEYVALGADFAGRTSDFYGGVDVVLRSFLQDIELLYRVESGTAVEGHPGVFRLTGFELATRMSYLIVGSTPDDGLLDLAEAGRLATKEDVAAAAQAMLASPRARAQIDRFHALWLGYDTLQHAPNLTQAMRAETRALVERVVFDQRTSWLDLFTSTQTYVDDTLAAHYGLPLPGAPAWVDASSAGRGGILSHGSFLSVAHDVGDTSPVRRGLHVLRRLTCQDVPPPPPNVDTTLVIAPAECKLDKLAAHAQGSCASCHTYFDSIGFGLEQYDIAGRFRTHEDNKPQCAIDGDGSLQGVGPFRGPAELGQKLVESGLLASCAVEHLYQYTLGRHVTSQDRSTLERLTTGFSAANHRFDDLVVALVSDDAFFFRRPEGGN